MVHPDQVASNADQVDSSPTFISDVPLLATDALALPFTAPTPLRRSNKPHNPPTYLHDYHCNLVAAHVLASTPLTQSHESNATSNSSILPLFHIANCPLHIDYFLLPYLLLKNQIPMLKP